MIQYQALNAIERGISVKGTANKVVGPMYKVQLGETDKIKVDSLN